MSEQAQEQAAAAQEKAGSAQETEREEHVEQPEQPEQQQEQSQEPQSEEDLWEQEMKSLLDEDPDKGTSEEKPEPKAEEPEEGEEPDEGQAEGDKPKAQEREGEEAEAGGQREEPEWFKALPDEAKDEIRTTFSQQHQQLQAMQQQYNSLHGKVAPVQRQAEQFRREKEELEQRLKAFESAPSSVEELEKLDSFKFLEEDSPEDAQKLKQAVAQMVARTTEDAKAKLDRTTRALQELQEDRTQRELNRLSQAHPDWSQARRSQEFLWWQQALPPERQQQVQAMLKSPYADEPIQVLNAFKEDMRNLQGSTQQQNPKPQGQQQPSQNTRPARRQPPKPSPSPQGSGVSGASRIPSTKSEEEIWEEEMARQDKKPVW